MYRESMIDIETLSTESNAVVLSVGAVLFNLEDHDTYDSLELEDRSFFNRLEFQSQIDLGRDVMASTIMWWMQQNRMAQMETFAEQRAEVTDTLAHLSKFVKGTNIWGNGATFDNVIMRSLYRDYEMKFPTPFFTDRDLRTLEMLSPIGRLAARGVEHSAIEDARYQVLCAQGYFHGIEEQLRTV